MRKYLLFLIALASIAFGVCSPVAAQVTLTGAGCSSSNCAGGGGGGLTSTDVSNLYNRLHTFLHAVNPTTFQ